MNSIRLASGVHGGHVGLSAATGSAQVPEIRFARQSCMGDLQFVMERRYHQLFEKHARAASIGDLKVVWATFNCPAAMHDALLSSSVDIVAARAPLGHAVLSANKDAAGRGPRPSRSVVALALK
jgi:NitT/TauT family transport system substrate-binding protein